MDNKAFDLDDYLRNDLEYHDEDNKNDRLEASKLESEVEHLRQWMSMYGLPKIGNILPGWTLEDSRATVRALTAMLDKRKEDVDFKTNIRISINDQSNKNHILVQENEKLQDK